MKDLRIWWRKFKNLWQRRKRKKVLDKYENLSYLRIMINPTDQATEAEESNAPEAKQVEACAFQAQGASSSLVGSTKETQMKRWLNIAINFTTVDCGKGLLC